MAEKRGAAIEIYGAVTESRHSVTERCLSVSKGHPSVAE